MTCLNCKFLPAISRGNCTSCLNQFHYRIKQGKLTWERLLQEGKTLPARNQNAKKKNSLDSSK